jgi:adenine-specific DNA-methyltransferase
MAKKKDYTSWDKDQLIEHITKLEKRKKYGLVWDEERTKEKFEKDAEGNLPVLKEVKGKAIENNPNKPTHILIEGDNYHALSVLNYTHENAIDVVYIDPPYNTGEDEFKYNDKYVNKEDGYRHSKWLSFMSKRLLLARELLNETGVIIVHIDEHEVDRLYLLMLEIFKEENDLGRIIWDKRNPKGDSQGVSILNEYILCFAKNSSEFLAQDGVFMADKTNAVRMLSKAKQLFTKLGKEDVPDDVKEVLKPYKFKKEQLNQFKVKYDLETINKEFQSWINKQIGLSGGEKAYKFIDEKGKVYRGVSMAWPNKKQAPDDYCIPLIHPLTKKKCPIPKRGWRNPPATMKDLLDKGLILFGVDENKQPERKYLLEENMKENVSSIFSFGGSDESMFEDFKIEFPYAKPVEVAKYLLKNIHPNPTKIVDFFAGSGTALHAVQDLNKSENKHIEVILTTNNENDICTKITYPRVQKINSGYETSKKNKINGYGENLKYFKTTFVPGAPTDTNREKLTRQSVEMLCLREGTFDKVNETEEVKVFKSNKQYTAILFNEEKIDELKKQIAKFDLPVNIYVFSLGDEDYSYAFEGFKNQVKVCSIPEAILRIYRRIFQA